MKWDREVYNKLHDAEYTLGFIRWSVMNDEVTILE